MSVLSSRSIRVTAGSKAIESGMVPTKRFRWQRLLRHTRGSITLIFLGGHFVKAMRCDSDSSATSAAVEKRGRRYMRTRSTSLPIDASIGPSREFPDKSLQEYHKRQPLATQKKSSIVLHRHTLVCPGCVMKGFAFSSSSTNGFQQGVPEYEY